MTVLFRYPFATDNDTIAMLTFNVLDKLHPERVTKPNVPNKRWHGFLPFWYPLWYCPI